MRWITALHLTRFAAERRCEEILPEIIRKLIIASCEDFPNLDLPIGDSVSKPGWDGSCISPKAGLLVPKGQSFWELGRTKNYAAKFKADFDKRDKETKVAVKKKSVFVFVTPWKWSRPDKTAFLEKVNQDSDWKEVRIYDADNLELWLEKCPSVGIWLARELDIFTHEVSSAKDYWKEFTHLKDYTLDADFVLCKRELQKKLVSGFFVGDPHFKELQASSTQEGAIFVIASMLGGNDKERESFLSKTVIVEDKKALKQLLLMHSGLFVIFLGAETDVDFSADVNGNHVISIVNFLFRLGNSGISLPIPKTGDFAEQLGKLGYGHRDTYTLAAQCGRSLTVLKRMLTDRAGRTNWSLLPSVTELLPLFFVQKMDDELEGDREVIGMLYPGGYQQYKSLMKRWSLLEDRPVSQTINHWQVVSAFDLLFVLGKYITEEDLHLFALVIKTVCEEINPALELDRKSRFAAVLYNKKSRYSSRLKKGIIETLALIAVYGGEAGINAGVQLEAWAHRIVMELLGNSELEHWQTIESRIDLLAETSPIAFLNAIEALVKKYPERITALFDDSDFDMFSPIYFTHILYALELIAWDPKFLARVSSLLADLTVLDQGKTTSNRAFNTLKAIFLWWMPQTYASFDQRKQVLTMLSDKKPVVAFRLLKELSPNISNVGNFSHKPVWRLRDESVKAITNQEYFDGLEFTCATMIKMAGADCGRWLTLLNLVDDYSGNLRKMILDAAEIAVFANEGKDELRASLKKLIDIHADSTGKKAWNLKKTDLDRLVAIYEQLIANDVDRYSWCFDVESVENRRSSKLSYDKLIEVTRKKRREALIKMLASCGLDAILEMANKVEYPFYLGQSLAGLEGLDEDKILSKIDSGGKLEKLFFGFVGESHQLFGLGWVNTRLEKYKALYPDEILVYFYLSIEGGPELWDLLDQGDPQMKDIYWTQVNSKSWPWFHKDHHERFVAHLIEYNRFATAINSMHDVGRVSDHLIIEVMKGYLSDKNKEDVKIHSGSYMFGKLMEKLVKNGTSREILVSLQWQYFRVLRQERNPILVSALYEDLSQDPSKFAQLVYFKRKPDEGDFEEEFAQAGKDSVMGRGQNADEVLEKWRKLPGMDDEYNCDFDVLRSYFSKALALCAEKNRRNGALYEFGELLGRGRFTTEQWPHPKVCDILEEYDEEELCRGFDIGYQNRNSGVVTSGGYDKVHSQQVISTLRDTAERLSISHPVTSKVINEIADSKAHWDKIEAKRAAQDED